MLFAEADIDGMLDAAGEDVRHQGSWYRAVVTDDYAEQVVGGRFRVTSSAPTLLVMDRAFYPDGAPVLTEEDTVTVRNVAHLIKTLRPHGDGFLEAELVNA